MLYAYTMCGSMCSAPTCLRVLVWDSGKMCTYHKCADLLDFYKHLYKKQSYHANVILLLFLAHCSCRRYTII